MKKLGILGMTALLAIAGTAPAFAQDPTYQGAGLYKDPNGNVVVAAGMAFVDTTSQIDLGGTEVTKLASADKCGVVAVTFPVGSVPATFTLDGATMTTANAVQAPSKGWTCNTTTGALVPGTGVTVYPDGTTNQFLSVGSADSQVPRKFYVYKTAQTGYTLKYSATVRKSVRINACGFGTLRDNVANNMSNTTTIKLADTPTVGAAGGATAVALSTLPTAPVAPKCTNGTLFVSGGWTF